MASIVKDFIEYHVLGEDIAANKAVYLSNGTGSDSGRTASRIYKLDVTNTDRSNFMGFTKDGGTAGQTVRVTYSGRLTGFASLIQGQPIYGSITVPGDIQTSLPVSSVKILAYAKDAVTALIFGAGGGGSGGSPGGLVTALTVAAAKALSGKLDNDLIYIVEVDGIYRYEATSMSGITANDKEVISVTSDANARWVGVAGTYMYADKGTLEYDTVALAQAATIRKNNDTCYVAETASYYQYVSSSMSGITADNLNVLSVTADANARWMAIAGKYQYNKPVATLEKRTTVNSAGTGSWFTGMSGKPQLTLRFWDNTASRFQYFDPSGFLESDSLGSTVYYDFTSMTFNASDFIEIIAAYADANVTNASEFDSGWLLVSAANNLQKGVSVSGWHEMNLPGGFLDYPAGLSVLIDDGIDIYQADAASTLVMSKTGSVIRVAFDATGLGSSVKFRVVASKNPRAVGYSPLKEYNITVTGTGWTTVRAIGIPYQTVDGTWRVKFNISGVVTSIARTSYSLTIVGITAKNVSNFRQPVSGYTNSSSATVNSGVVIDENTGLISFLHASATTSLYAVSGDIELESKPTWAD